MTQQIKIVLAIVSLMWATQSPHAETIKEWFNSLRSQRGICCYDYDGIKLQQLDWDVTATGYRVVIEGAWKDVPPDAVVNSPNRLNDAFVWMVGKDYIRCFIPGNLG